MFFSTIGHLLSPHRWCLAIGGLVSIHPWVACTHYASNKACSSTVHVSHLALHVSTFFCNECHAHSTHRGWMHCFVPSTTFHVGGNSEKGRCSPCFSLVSSNPFFFLSKDFEQTRVRVQRTCFATSHAHIDERDGRKAASACDRSGRATSRRSDGVLVVERRAASRWTPKTAANCETFRCSWRSSAPKRGRIHTMQ